MRCELIDICRDGNLEKVKYLVEIGVDIHINDDAPLRWASYNGHLDTVQYLIKNGANIYAHDNACLRYAAAKNHLHIVNYLRNLEGKKWKCYECIVRVTCINLCKDWNEK